ncbi:MAG: RNA-binding transcriptional accessory protein, partial [Marinilabiliales bacterium]
MSDLHVKNISTSLNIDKGQVLNTLKLLNGGATIPFISRYRKELTGSLDEVQIGEIDKLNKYFCQLDKRKETIIASITEQEKLTPDLED